MRIILLVIPACLLVLAQARRVQLRPRVQEPQIYYEDEEAQPAEADDYAAQVAYQPRTRALPSPRSKDSLQGSKPPPVQTIRNYNKVNDDGSFTFGYEAADGSFKEETRGTDCVVRGKYGYVDPDGNKREFTYVSGNPCDPNAPKDEDDDDLAKKQEPDDVSGPANYPSVRPVPRQSRPNYPTTTARAPTTIFQTEYQLDDDASQELEEEAKPQQLRPSAFRRPQYVQVAAEPSSPIYQPAPTTSPTLYRLASTASAPRYHSPTTPAPARQQQQSTYSSSYYQPIESSTRAAVTASRARPQSVAITPRPHVAQVAAQYVSPSSTERPGVVFAPRTITPVHSTTTATPPSQHLDFAAELERYVNSVGSSTPRPQVVQTPKYVKAAALNSGRNSDPIYQSELVYDPATGQYNTQLYQTLPQTLGDFSLSHKLQPFVASQQQPLIGLQQSPIYRSAASVPQPAQQPSPARQQIQQPQETIYRKQQSQLLQQSQNLYAQQQRRQQQPGPQQQQHQQQQQQQQHQQPQRLQLLQDAQQREPQNFYYIAAAQSPQQQAGPISLGQIDQFLRNGHNSF